jgi:uncharacterized phage protein gp47/JayE
MSTLPDLGQVYVPQTASEIRDQWLRDYRVGMIEAGVSDPVVLPGSEPYIRATCNANMALGCFASIEISAQDTSELTAQGQALDNIREAIGLPEVGASASAGKIKLAISKNYSATIADGTQLVTKNGTRIKVVGTWTSVVNNDQIDVVSIDLGSKTNAGAGEKVRWTAPPVGVFNEAEVVAPGLTGGSDAEDDERKRERILNRRRNLPAGGNSAHLIEIAEASTSSIQKAFCYPALGGPGSAKIVVIKEVNIDDEDFSRVVPVGQVEIVENAILAEAPEPVEIVVQSVEDEDVDVALRLYLPDPTSSGGTSVGWENYSSVYPALSGGDVVADVKSVVSDTEFRLSNNCGTPIVGITKIAWWNPVTQSFTIGVVTGYTVGATTTVTVDTAFTGIQAGDYISPAAANIASYRGTWLNIMSGLGPGENTSSNYRLPRAKRKPTAQESYPSDLGTAQLSQLINNHSEILDAIYSYRSISGPTVPASVADAPNVLKLRRFGIYKK